MYANYFRSKDDGHTWFSLSLDTDGEGTELMKAVLAQTRKIVTEKINVDDFEKSRTYLKLLEDLEKAVRDAKADQQEDAG